LGSTGTCMSRCQCFARLVLMIAVVAGSGLAGCGRTEPQPAEQAAAPGESAARPGGKVNRPSEVESGEVEVDLRDQSISPQQIEALVRNPALRRLRVSGSDIDDAALARLAAETKLELL